MSELNAVEYKRFEDITNISGKMEVSIGAHGIWGQRLIMQNGKILKK